VVVVGAGFGGASLARALRRMDAGISVTVIERDPRFVTCPSSNLVLGGLREIASITFGFGRLEAAGVEVIHDTATGIDPIARSVSLAGGNVLQYDRLVLSPGVQMTWNAIEGYDEAAAEVMPHAWLAGPQTLLLRQQIEAMEDGGLVVISVPANPFRCPPGPYERASMIAHYLKAKKPRSKLLILDSKDEFSKQGLFAEAWEQIYPGMIEWVSGSEGGRVLSVTPATITVSTEFEDYTPAVANIIPPQAAGQIALSLGLDGGKGFCAVDPRTFESAVAPGIHLIGDAIIAGAMPKSGFSANSQAKVCGDAIVSLLRERPLTDDPKLINTCYSVVAPDYGFSVAGVYHPGADGIVAIEGSGGTSPLNAPAETRALEAFYARSWYDTITAEMFG
jgi:NADPH-dependent 2,4-dienoyl-CoA reductase/sulfur reductase-like enzyme